MKRSPINAFHTERNATFITRNGWCLPSRFENPLEEYAAVRRRAGWLDFANRVVIEFSGPDAGDWLQGMLSNDIKGLSPGEGVPAAILNIHGKILADVRVLYTGETYLVDLWEHLKAGVREHLERHLVADEVEIADPSDGITQISIQGPDARERLSLLVNNDNLPASTLEHIAIQHKDSCVRVIAANHTGEDGFDLLIEPQLLQTWLSQERDKPAAAAIPWIGLEAQNILRIEAGIPLYGIDMDDGTLLLETNLDAAVSFTKGCYLGQEVVERIHSRGHVNRKLVGLKCSGDQVPNQGDVIGSTDRPNIGAITSATLSPELRCPVALGYVNREYTAASQPLVVQHESDRIPAVVAELPFYSR